MFNKKLIESFTEFAKSKNINRPTIIKIIEDVFKTIIKKKFEKNDNFVIILNLDKGDLQIYRFREIIDNNSEDIWEHDKISLSEAKKIENDFEIGEEVIEDINIKDFGRRLITIAKKTLIQKIKDLEKDNLYEKYSKIIGKIINAKIYQITNKKIILIDKDKNELILPKTEQIPKDKFKKGEYINSIIHKVYLKNNILKIILSRTSPIFLKKLLEREIPEIYDGIITIKKIVREPGEKSKVAVESYNERIDPVGSCIGIKGSRIYNIVKELKNENIDIINYTDNIELYISRILNPVKISSIKQKENKILIYIKQDQISLAIGKFGQNIRLASKLIGKEIDVYKDLDCEKKDIKIEEFQNKIDTWIIEELKKSGFNTAKSILSTSKKKIEKEIDLEKETVEEIYKTLKKEFE